MVQLHKNGFNSVSDLVLKIWYRISFDQSELSVSNIPPIDFCQNCDRVLILELVDRRCRGDKPD